MAEKALLVMDLDGTLLCSDRTLDTRTVAALTAAAASGVTRIVATGRSLFSVRRTLPADAPIDYVVFSSGAGAVAWGPGKGDTLLFSHRLPAAAVTRALAFTTRRHMDVMVHAPPPDSHRFGYHARGEGHPDLWHRRRAYAGHAWDLAGTGGEPVWEGDACQLVAIPPGGDHAELFDEARRALAGFQVIRTTSPLDHASLWLEIFPRHVCKSAAARWFAQRLGIASQRTFAVGNDFNDADLLAWAHRAAVVANAPAALREQHLVVASHDEGGVAELIERELL